MIIISREFILKNYNLGNVYSWKKVEIRETLVFKIISFSIYSILRKNLKSFHLNLSNLKNCNRGKVMTDFKGLQIKKKIFITM